MNPYPFINYVFVGMAVMLSLGLFAYFTEFRGMSFRGPWIKTLLLSVLIVGVFMSWVGQLFAFLISHLLKPFVHERYTAEGLPRSFHLELGFVFTAWIVSFIVTALVMPILFRSCS